MLCFWIIVACFTGTFSARILGIFPIPSVSHQTVFDAYVHELIKHGHDLVIVTTKPTKSKNDAFKNLTEIDISSLHETFNMKFSPSLALAKRGVVRDADTMFEVDTYKGVASFLAEVFVDSQVKRLIQDRNQRFDLIVVEAFLNYHLITSQIFNAPVILISTFYGLPEHFEVIGAVSRHPILYPNLLRNKFRDLSIWDIIKECYKEYEIMKRMQDIEIYENALLKQNFGPNAPTVKELNDNVAMLFLNAHPLFGDNRPVPPGVIYLGALHLKPVQDLPEGLKTYLDNSKRGIVYVSFGSNIRPELMHDDLLEVFLTAFEDLPYDILWKYNGDLVKMPKNLKTQKWFPQRDLLTHPNIKVFIMQGGLQSTDEAIDAGVPLVGIPMQGDQWFNTNKFIQFGIGVQLDAVTLAANDLISAVETVISDERKNIKRLKEIINDQPQRPLERAVWWTEHVLRHGPAHLRAPAANMSWAEYLMLDIFIPVFLLLLSFLIVFFILIYFIIQLSLGITTKQSKKKSS